MKRSAQSILLLALFLFACTGVQSEIKKSWQNDIHTLNIVDLTAKNYNLMDAGSRLQSPLEDSVGKTGFQLAGEEAKFHLKYKIIEYDSGSPLGRIATLGVSDAAQAKLRVKVALFSEDELVGGWVVDSWQKVGLTDKKLFAKAAEEIAGHLKGDF